MNAIILLIQKALYPFKIIQGWLAKIPGLGGFSLKLTLAGKIAWTFGFCLTVALLFHCLWFAWFTKKEPSHSITSTEKLYFDYPIYILLGLVASALLYWGIRYATLELPSLYPEIDRCWDALDRWRTNEKLEWDEFERYLLLGGNFDVVKAIHACRTTKGFGPLPSAEKEWMHWLGDNSRVFLHCKDTCELSRVLKYCPDLGRNSKRRTYISDTILPDSMSPGNDSQMPELDSGMPMDTLEPSRGFQIGGETLDPFDSGVHEPYEDPPSIHVENSNVNAQSSTLSTATDGDEDDRPCDRLRYLAELARSRACGSLPFEGILVVIPFNSFLEDKYFKSITDGLKSDLNVIHQSIDTTLPVMIMFSSMENDLGFPKLMTLISDNKVKEGRFGAGGAKPFEIPSMTSETVRQAVERTIKSFESWVYNRWGKASQLSAATQNVDLYKMLIRVRGKFKPHFQHLVHEVFGQSSLEGDKTPFMFGGSYFAATGKQEIEQGFVAGTLAKCDELSELSGWGKKSLEKDRLYSVLATLFFVLGLGLILATLAYLWLGES